MKVLEKGTYHVTLCIGDYEDWNITFRWDGCFDIKRFFNGTKTIEDNDFDRLHVCDFDQFIKILQIAKQEAGKHLVIEN